MIDYTVALVANIPITLTIRGKNFHIFEASARVRIKIGSGTVLTRYQGTGDQGEEEFNRLEITSEVDQTIVIAVGYGIINDARSNVQATLSTTIAPANINEGLADVTILPQTTAKVANANKAQKELLIGLPASNLSHVRWGDALISNTKGGIIDIGGNASIETEASVYIYNPHATESVTVNLVSMRRI